jgi:hypothetical protein
MALRSCNGKSDVQGRDEGCGTILRFQTGVLAYTFLQHQRRPLVAVPESMDGEAIGFNLNVGRRGRGFLSGAVGKKTELAISP